MTRPMRRCFEFCDRIKIKKIHIWRWCQILGHTKFSVLGALTVAGPHMLEYLNIKVPICTYLHIAHVTGWATYTKEGTTENQFLVPLDQLLSKVGVTRGSILYTSPCKIEDHSESANKDSSKEGSAWIPASDEQLDNDSATSSGQGATPESKREHNNGAGAAGGGGWAL